MPSRNDTARSLDDETVPMVVANDVTTYHVVPSQVEEDISDGKPSTVSFEMTQQMNTIRLVLPERPAPRVASGEVETKEAQEWEIVLLDAEQRLFVLQAMLEMAHNECEIDPNDDGVMDGPVGAYDMERAPKIRTNLPIAEAIPLRRETLDESVDGVKLIIFRLGMLCHWLTIAEKNEFSSVRPGIPVPLRQSALRFLHHVTKRLNEYEPINPQQPTILEVSAS
jgi:hypothetical protein